MAQFSVVIVVPDPQVAAAIAGLKKVRPVNPGESDLNYLKRVTRELLFETSAQGMQIINQQALTPPDPGITVT